MLTHLQIQNFKTWRDTGPIRLAPLTVIFGQNSAGKSSLGQLLLALKQTALAAERKRPLLLGGERALVDLGSFADCIHNRDLTQPLTFELGWQLPTPLEVSDPLSAQHSKGEQLRLRVALLADAQQQPHVQQLSYRLREGATDVLTVDYQAGEQEPQLRAEPYRLVPNRAASGALDAPDKFYRISERTLARYQNAGFLTDFALATETALAGLEYLGPLRDTPKRLYAWTGESPEGLGPRGEHAIAALLAARVKQRRLSLGPGQPQYRFEELVAGWLKHLGLIHDFALQPIAPGRREHEVLVKTSPQAEPVHLADVGSGVAHTLPAVLLPFYCAPHSTVWLEQPEIYLHPQAQAHWADVLITALFARERGRPRQTQIIVESHSEHFLNRLQRRVAEGTLAPEQVAIYFCRRTEAAAELEPLHLNKFGAIENWPDNFFGDEMADISARALAAMTRKRQEPPA